MPKRKYELPNFQDLNKKQDAVLRLPNEGSHLVVGGPGTGKSVVALMKVKKLYNSFRSDEKLIFLTYNKVLKNSTEELVGKLEAQTSHSWLGKTFYDLCKNCPSENRPASDHYHMQECFLPEKKENERTSSADSYFYDYKKIKDFFDTQYKNQLTQVFIIVDEAQDMPVDFYEAMLCLGHSNILLVADQNQTITNQNSTTKELKTVLDLESDEVVKLDENYRNNTPIAILADHFYTDLTSPRPKIPNRPSIDTPQLLNFHNTQQCYSAILREYDNDPTKLIGLIVASEIKRESYESYLKSTEIERDNDKPFVRSYSSQMKQEPDMQFSESGIIVLTDKSAKGLEFDSVFIILEDFKIFGADDIGMKKRFYVMVSRAKDKLFFLKHVLYKSPVVDLLPDDENILKRRVLNNV